jgi:hypothetical protein
MRKVSFWLIACSSFFLQAKTLKLYELNCNLSAFDFFIGATTPFIRIQLLAGQIIIVGLSLIFQNELKMNFKKHWTLP